MSWSIANYTGQTVSNYLLSCVEIISPEGGPHLVHHVSSHSMKEEVTLSPFQEVLIRKGCKYAIPVFESGYEWQAAAYLIAKDSSLIWYQLSCDMSNMDSNRFLILELVRV